MSRVDHNDRASVDAKPVMAKPVDFFHRFLRSMFCSFFSFAVGLRNTQLEPGRVSIRKFVQAVPPGAALAPGGSTGFPDRETSLYYRSSFPAKTIFSRRRESKTFFIIPEASSGKGSRGCIRLPSCTMLPFWGNVAVLGIQAQLSGYPKLSVGFCSDSALFEQAFE